MSPPVIEGMHGSRIAVDRLPEGPLDLLVYDLGPPTVGQAIRLHPAQALRLIDALALELGLPEEASAQLRAIAIERGEL